MTNGEVRAVLVEYLQELGIDWAPCGDNSCWFGSPGGQATNGGCRCIRRGEPNPPDARRAIVGLARVVHRMAQEIAARRAP